MCVTIGLKVTWILRHKSYLGLWDIVYGMVLGLSQNFFSNYGRLIVLSCRHLKGVACRGEFRVRFTSNLGGMWIGDLCSQNLSADAIC